VRVVLYVCVLVLEDIFEPRATAKKSCAKKRYGVTHLVIMYGRYTSCYSCLWSVCLILLF